MLDECLIVLRQSEFRDGRLRAVFQRAGDTRDALTGKIARLDAENGFANGVRRYDVAILHREEAEACVGDADAFNEIGELIECYVRRNHACDIPAVACPDGMEERNDQFSGDSVDIVSGRYYIRIDRLAVRLAQPGLPTLVDSWEKEVPEVARFIVSWIKLVKCLSLL